MPTPPFYLTLSPPGQLTTLGNSEKVLVTSKTSAEVFECTRAQGDTTSKTVVSGWIAVNSVYTDDLLTSSMTMGEVLTGTPNGVLTAFTTASAFTLIEVFKNGVRLRGGAGNDYTTSGQTITFATAPATGAVLLANYILGSQLMITGSNSLITKQAAVGTVNSSNTSFSVSKGSYIAGSLQVYINGLRKSISNVTETTPASGTFALDTAPLTGDNVEVGYQFVSSVSGNADTVDGIHANTTATASQLYPVTTGLPIQTASVSYGNVATGTTLLPYDDTIPQNNEGDQYMTITFTPKSATNRLIIEASVQISHTAVSNVSAALFQDSVANALAAGEITEETSGFVRNIPIFCDMVSGTTSATTFKIRAGSSSAGTTTFNGTTGQRRFGGIPTSWIKITEYAG